MGLEAVKEEIIRSARQQESALVAEARKEANKIMKEAEAKTEEMKAISEADAKKAAEAMKRQALASGEMESRKLVLEAKKQVIENVFSEAKKRLEALDDRKREEFMKKLLEKAGKELEVAYIYYSKKDAKFVKGIGVEASPIIGGLIAENKERTIRVDYSFETMLEAIKEKELQNINKLLFS